VDFRPHEVLADCLLQFINTSYIGGRNTFKIISSTGVERGRKLLTLFILTRIICFLIYVSCFLTQQVCDNVERDSIPRISCGCAPQSSFTFYKRAMCSGRKWYSITNFRIRHSCASCLCLLLLGVCVVEVMWYAPETLKNTSKSNFLISKRIVCLDSS
jgi:hypothetical protein